MSKRSLSQKISKWKYTLSIGVFNFWKIKRRKKIKYVHIDKTLMQYIERVSEKVFPKELSDLRIDTESLPMSNMQIDANQAAFLQFLIQTVQAKRILEIGTFRGFSAACMAYEKVSESIVTIEARKESADIALKFWNTYLPLEVREKIHHINGEAKKILEQSDVIQTYVPFDLVFIDADKTGYKSYFNLTRNLVRQGGLIVLDNMLNAGLVATSAHDKTTNALRDLNAALFSDSEILADFDSYLIPAWDGVIILRKK